MPFYVHAKDVDISKDLTSWEVPDTILFFDDRSTAYQAAQSKIGTDGKPYVVTFIASEEEKHNWQRREKERFRSGEYLDVPWFGNARTACEDHYVHLSVKQPGMVAYTPSDEHGVQDRQVIIKPGRYLEQFYATDDYFSRDAIAEYIAQCAADNQTLRIATSREDIKKVYASGSVTSCMSPGPHLTGHIHPCEVYGDSDLAVAYFGPIEHVSARAIVWPEKKIYSRTYGSTSVLQLLLKNGGWTAGSLDGARIRHIDYKGLYLMPYVDGIDSADDIGNGWLRLGEGDISTSETCGYASSNENWLSCECCGERYDPDDDDAYDGWCADCSGSSGCCENCNHRYSDDSMHYLDNGSYCNDCYEQMHETCQDEHCSEQWIECAEFTSAQTVERKRTNTADLCPSCAAQYHYCDDCQASYHSVENAYACPTCGKAERCDKTQDLLTDIPVCAHVSRPDNAFVFPATGSTDVSPF